MTIAERLIQKGFEKGALEVAREIACRLRDMGCAYYREGDR
ncbi:hypothetical protein ACVTXO_000301 [Shigella sonnei]